MEVNLLRRGEQNKHSKDPKDRLFHRNSTASSRHRSSYTYYILVFITLLVFIAFWILHLQHIGFSDSKGEKIGTGLSPTISGVLTSFSYADIDEPLENEAKGPIRTAKLPVKPSGSEQTIARSKTQKRSAVNAERSKSIIKPDEQLSNLTPSQQKRIRNSRKQRKFQSNKLWNYQHDWGYDGKEKYIEVLPTKKIPLKKDRRVVFPNLTIERPFRPLGVPSGIVGEPRGLVSANHILQQHLFFRNQTLADGSYSLDEVMVALQRLPSCFQKPLFITMATVGDDLYWQLIENFVYTMVKFGLSDCVVVICVSDERCMKLCAESLFPCYNYHEQVKPLPSVMEQIAKVKLYYVPLALKKGVDVFMLDLDVGFLGDPKIMVKAFVETPIVDILVQEDYIFIMNRTKAGWKTWFTEPLPNIGLFLCRGNNRTARVFEIAWEKYLLMDDPVEKAQPGKDQNHVLEAMRIGRGTFGLKYAYFSNYTAPLMDKLVFNYGVKMELGGELMESFLLTHHSLAIHTTCYEKSTKVMGLKAANAFWNPRYYDPLRRTITKPLLFINHKQVQEEVRTLLWLGIVTNRDVIIPNLIGPPKDFEDRVKSYHGQVLWPGFRVAHLRKPLPLPLSSKTRMKILEPAYYWRISRDYDEIPRPKVLLFDSKNSLSLDELLETIQSEEVRDIPRLVLSINPLRTSSSERRAQFEEELTLWANDSVGLFPQDYRRMKNAYRPLPSLKTLSPGAGAAKDSRVVTLASEVRNSVRNCLGIFDPPRGNRSCFQICK